VEKFESVYDDPAIRVPVYPTLGNHDHVGFPVAQVRYSDRSDTWRMPARYYSFSRVLADGTEIAFFALDTEIIRSGAKGDPDDTPLEQRMANVRRMARNNEVDLSERVVRRIAESVHIDDVYGILRIIMLAERTGRSVDEAVVDEALAGSGFVDYPAQLEWLDRRLAESTAQWKIVYGHHPLYSHAVESGRYPAMIERLEPILIRHGVDVYLAGHDHVLDMMKPVKGVHHITSGGGSGDDEAYDVLRTDESYYAATGGGFTLFRVTRDEMVIDFVDLEGITRHTQVLRHSSRPASGT
jgi:3',5'-cyclic AMP phosphodiesterase CpdA